MCAFKPREKCSSCSIFCCLVSFASACEASSGTKQRSETCKELLSLKKCWSLNWLVLKLDSSRFVGTAYVDEGDLWSRRHNTSVTCSYPLLTDECTMSLWGLPVVPRKEMWQPWKRETRRIYVNRWIVKTLKWIRLHEAQTSVDFIGDEGLWGAGLVWVFGWRCLDGAQVQQLRGAPPLSCIHPWVICERQSSILVIPICMP